MFSDYKTPLKTYKLKTDIYVCNKFGLAEFFAANYESFGDMRNIRALDAGCGVLPIGIFLADQKQNKVVGVEMNKTAVKCAKYNINKLGLKNDIELIADNFALYKERYEGSKFDLIASNPPIDDKTPQNELKRGLDDCFYPIDDESYSFLTNSWRSSEGKDLSDYIFEFGNKHLHKDGKIITVFCDVNGVAPDYIYDKALKYGYKATKTISSNILPQDIGLNSNKIASIKVYMTEFKFRSNKNDDNR